MMLPNGLRRCCGCRRDFPPTREHFYGSRHASDGLQGKCKECDNAHRCRRNLSGNTIYHRIARELGVTVTRVKQIEAAALQKLRRNRRLRELVS